MTHLRTALLGVCISVLLGGCDGSDDGATETTGTTYPFIAPALDSMRTYNETFIDSSNNTINYALATQITSVNSNGSYTESSSSPDGVNTVDGLLPERNRGGCRISYGPCRHVRHIEAAKHIHMDHFCGYHMDGKRHKLA
ncbi:MAG TPA: hypothetical protein VMF64_13480 [Steroidobacteraceae bacterium]|nr:hypothetical protein [Steroidobacteraceae bacterium]